MVIKLVDESNGVGDAFLLHGDGAGMIRNADDLEAFLRAENNFATLTQIASNPIARTRAISQGFANACVMHRCPLPTPPDETQSRPRCARPLLLRAAAVLSPARARTQLKTSRAQASDCDPINLKLRQACWPSQKPLQKESRAKP